MRVLTQLTDNNGPDNQSGPFSFGVLAGEIYGFYIGGDGSLGRADIQVTALAASETPLPAALPLFATGLGALGLLGWRRKKKAAATAA